MSTSQPPDTANTAADRRVRVAFDEIAIEDVLAARVLRKALGAIGAVLAFVVLVATYAVVDIKQQRTELTRKRDSLNIEAASMRASFARLQDSLAHELQRASSAVSSAESYQRSMVQQLVDAARNQERLEFMRRDVDSAAHNTVLAATALRRSADSIAHVATTNEVTLAASNRSLDAFCMRLNDGVRRALESAVTANHAALNRWGQEVDEERRTPIQDSGFWIQFDDISHTEKQITHAALWFDDGRGQVAVRQWPRLRIGDVDTVTVDHATYRLLVLSSFRDHGRIPFLHNDRVVVQLERLAALDVASVSADSARCAARPAQATASAQHLPR